MNLLRDFNAHVGNGGRVWRCMINQHGDADKERLLQLCCNNSLCIMNTFFQHRDVHGCRKIFFQGT